MKKVLLILSLLLILPASNSFAIFKPVKNLESIQIKRVAVSALDASVIYAASKNSLYKFQSKNETFKKIAVFKNDQVQHMFFDHYLADTLYIVTNRYLYQMKDRLEKLYSSPDEELIYTAAKYKENFYIGTSSGLYFASEGLLIWKKSKRLRNVSINHITPHKQGLYLSTDSGVYLLKEEDQVERLLVMRKPEDQDADGLSAKIIKADIFNKERLWLGTNRGMFVSDDEGVNWQKVYLSGIDNLSINCIVQTNLHSNIVYLASTKGFFAVDLKRNKSKQIFEGLPSSYIWWAEFTPDGEIYLATSKGLFKNNYFTSSYQIGSVEEILIDEPSIADIQQSALKYNEVHPDKIRKWRKDVRRRAWLPKFNVGIDKDINEQYHWASTSADNYRLVAKGPDEEDFGWDISFEWDLADLVWNSSQTSIDVRARLNTQTRLDILDEINRVYFERLRLKKEILDSQASQEELFSKKLRLQELTATIDGYTGGYFTRKSEEINE